MRMKTLLAGLALTTALTVPELAMARPVTLTTTLKNYGGNGAYLALYVTDASGAYKGTLWVACISRPSSTQPLSDEPFRLATTGMAKRCLSRLICSR